MAISTQPNEIVIIIGAMKSGTTSLFSYLEQHPEIASSRLKEPGFFAADEVWQKGIEWYFRLWDFRADRHRVAMEATTDYTKLPLFPKTIERMKSIETIKFKFIYIMRNPLERIESQALHMGRVKTESGFIAATDTDYSFDNGISQNLIEFSKYAMQLEPYCEHFGMDTIYLTTLEQLKENPKKVMDEIVKFLALSDFSFDNLNETYNPAKTKNRPNKVYQYFSSLNWMKRIYHSFTTENFRSKLYHTFGDTTGLKRKSRFTLTPAEKLEIEAKLKPDLILLRDKYGIDVEKVWGIQSIADV